MTAVNLLAAVLKSLVETWPAERLHMSTCLPSFIIFERVGRQEIVYGTFRLRLKCSIVPNAFSGASDKMQTFG